MNGAESKSFLQILDTSMRALLFSKFQTAMDLRDENTDCVLFPKEVAQREVAEKRGEGSVEFINLWRTQTKFAWDRQRSPTARHGFYMEYDAEDKKDIINVFSVPVDLVYNVWFWSKDLDVLQKVAEQYLFWVHREPKLYLNLNDKYPLEIYMKFSELVDESSIPIEFDHGVYFVLRTAIKVDGWVFEVPSTIKTILRIHVAVFDDLNQPPILLTDWWIPS